MPLVYTYVCPRITDDGGKWLSGCGKGWSSDKSGEKCSTCGKPAQQRGMFGSIGLR